MKRFLYYDQDSVNSFLAQIEQGLLVKGSQGDDESTTTSSTTGITSDISGDLSAKVFGIGAALKGNVQGDDSDTEATTTLIRNVQEKVLHDYAIERVFKYVEENDLINNQDPKIGDVVLVNEPPTFLDFDYFITLFSEKGAVKYNNDQEKKKADAIIKEVREKAKGSKMDPAKKKAIKDLEDKLKEMEKQRKEFLDSVEIIKNTLPYKRLVMTSNMLIPLDDENFRDNPDIVAFKYGGNMSVFGYVTNIISAEKTPAQNNDFAPLYDTVNKVMLSIFKGQDKIYIVHPVALFY